MRCTAERSFAAVSVLSLIHILISFALSLAAGGNVVGYVSQNLGTALCPALIVVGFGRLWSTSGRSGSIHRAVILVICILISLIVPAVAVYAFAAAGVAAVISDFVKSKTNNPVSYTHLFCGVRDFIAYNGESEIAQIVD